MSIQAYHLIHICSVMLLFTALGSVIMSATDRYHKPAAIMHGVSLLLLLVSGFGMLAKLGHMGDTKYWMAKIFILLLIGASLVLAKRKLLHPPAMVSIILALGFLAAYLGYMKPF